MTSCPRLRKVRTIKTNWDYTELADAYLTRPDYAPAAIDAMVTIAGPSDKAPVCDVGAGVAHLTLMLAGYGYTVTAVEPNDAMRANGIKRTEELSNVTWYEGTGEETGRETGAYELVTFGSSFNVCDRALALKETKRILKPNGWFACMWNHRSLLDPIQKEIENVIKSHIAGYDYGTRREDQTEVINTSELFGDVVRISADVRHEQKIEDCVEAWRSHSTLERQAGSAFHAIIADIEVYLKSLNVANIQIPYTTNIWMAQLR